MLARQAAVTFELCIKHDQRQAQMRQTSAMLKGFVKLAGKTTTAELAHKSGLLCKEVCGASQARCVAVCCKVLQCVAVCCKVLQCVAVCCSVEGDVH